MRAVVTPDDLKKGDLVEPMWYPLELTDYSEEVVGKDAKNQGSLNCIFHFKIFDGPNKGVSPRTQFNETALGYGKLLWAALKLPFDPKKGYDLSTELFRAQIGKKIKGYIRRGKNKDTGKEFNELVDFQPLEEAPKA